MARPSLCLAAVRLASAPRPSSCLALLSFLCILLARPEEEGKRSCAHHSGHRKKPGGKRTGGRREKECKVKLKQRTRRRRGFPLSTGDVCRYGEPCRMQRGRAWKIGRDVVEGRKMDVLDPPNPPTTSTTPSSFPYLCQPFIPDPRNSRSGGHNARMHHHPRRPSLALSFSRNYLHPLLLTLSSSNLSLNKARSETLF